MANNLQIVVKMARVLAIAHIVVGALLICFGIADYVTSTRHDFIAGDIFFGVWIGVWMCVTGGLGIPGSRRERTRSRNCFASVFMGFSITSVVMGVIIIYFYGFAVDYYSEERGSRRYRGMYNTKMALAAVILVLGIVEFVIGIWAAICCCMMRPCACCTRQQGSQVVYTASTPGYVTTHGPDGNTVVVPMQAVDGLVAVQASGSQGSQPPVMLMPPSGAVGGEPLIVLAAPSHAVEATGYRPQEGEMPSLYGYGQFNPLNEEIPGKI